MFSISRIRISIKTTNGNTNGLITALKTGLNQGWATYFDQSAAGAMAHHKADHTAQRIQGNFCNKYHIYSHERKQYG